MRKIKKGFTLIELLAVIIILAIVALIATPLILNAIEDAEKSANASQVELLLKGADLYYSNAKLSGTDIKFDEIDNFFDLIETSGEKPEDGIIKINEVGNVYLSVYIDEVCYFKDYKASEVSEASKTKEECLTYTSTVKYVEANLNGSDPVLTDGLYPVIIADNGDVTITDGFSKWYEYETKIWANAITLKAGETVSTGDVLTDDSKIAAYYVWVPRYEYQIIDNSTNGVNPVEIRFVSKSEGVKMPDSPTFGEYYLHPAFTYGSEEVSGFWVGKFELTGSVDTPTILPNVESINNLVEDSVSSIHKLFTAAVDMDTDYGLSNDLSVVDSRLIKNMEWGAVAYLSYSKYGINGNVWANSNPNITGCGIDVEDGFFNDEECINAYGTITVYNQSTTGNISGIFDMAGGIDEYVMGVLEGYETYLNGFSDEFFDGSNARYYESFALNGASEIELANYGDATLETKGWDGAYTVGLSSARTWLTRGGVAFAPESATLFSIGSYRGAGAPLIGARVAMTIY